MVEIKCCEIFGVLVFWRGMVMEKWAKLLGVSCDGCGKFLRCARTFRCERVGQENAVIQCGEGVVRIQGQRLGP